MAVKTVRMVVSDLSGEEVSEENSARVTIVVNGGERFEIDASKEELLDWLAIARPVARRGRRPQSEAAQTTQVEKPETKSEAKSAA